jgi:nicotinamidase-related amidase
VITLDPRSTALVLIDLQNGILALDTRPRPSSEVLAAGRSLAGRFRVAGSPVVLVRVAFAPDYADAPPGLTDVPSNRPKGGLPAEWSRLADGLAAPSDLLVVKHQWGAFHGTDLDLQLRRRGIDTIVIGGIATNFGVESTVRQAWEFGYHVVVVEDACAAISTELHTIAVRTILPRIARVALAADLAFAGRGRE